MGFLYRLDFSSGKSYIGVTKVSVADRLKRHRYASSRRKLPIYSAWAKHGAPSVVTLAEVDNADLVMVETNAIRVFSTQVPGGYNLTAGGDGLSGFKMSAATIEKIKKAQRGRVISEKTREKLRQANLGKKVPDAVREKIRIGMSGLVRGPQSAEHIEKLRLARLGRVHSPAQVAKTRAKLTGVKHSPERVAARVETRRKNKEKLNAMR